MDRLSALKTITGDAQAGKVDLPSQTAVLLKLRQQLEDPECHLDRAAQLLQGDPALAARAVAAANSIAFNPGGQAITDIKRAASRLGFGNLKALVMAELTRQMAGRVEVPELVALHDELWRHTIRLAATARVLARRVTAVNPDTAFFAGLVHEVGGFFLIRQAARFPGLLAEAASFADEAAIGEAEAALCLAVLEKIGVPAEVIDAICDFWRGYVALPPKTLADTLILADYLVPGVSPIRWRMRQPPSSPADLDLQVGDRSLKAVLDEAEEEIAALVQALGG